MKRVVALLAAALASVGLAACGGNGAEPGAPRGAALVLDFQPNAVHTGIYSALRRGYYSEAGVRLTVRQPSDSTDAPKLLRAGRVQFAIMDIHDLAIAREHGSDVIGLAPVVQRPLAAVIAGDAKAVRTPKDLEGKRVGVTGLPSDDAVLDSVLQAGHADPKKVKRVTIGFNAVTDLAAHKVAAATAFWNAEGVALKRQDVHTREFRVDRFGAPPYPELVLVTSRAFADDNPRLVTAMRFATERGYRFTAANPAQSLDDLARSVKGIDRADQAAELKAVLPALRPQGGFNVKTLEAWDRWEVQHGIIKRPLNLAAVFPTAR